MNVFLIGSGGREHAIAWKITQSPLLQRLYCLRGNPKIEQLAETIDCDPDQPEQIIAFCQEKAIDLVIIGPERFLVAGLADHLRKANIAVLGPSAQAAQLEGAKSFTKEFCRKFAIPTATYAIFDKKLEALDYITAYSQQSDAAFPLVIKADGLAAGKGVIIAQNQQEALEAVITCFEGGFGQAGHKIVIEEFLEGEELSFFFLCDGHTAVPLGTAQDHKRLLDGDLGPNTGGMGAYSPAHMMNPALYEDIIHKIIRRTLDGLKQMDIPFQGVLFAGLMITDSGPKLLEYNVRFGDPETQVLLPLFAKDLLLYLKAAAQGQLQQITQNTIYNDTQNPHIFQKNQFALTVVMAAANYPEAPQLGAVIEGLEEAEKENDVVIFHAGTKLKDEDYIANGGRVLNVTAWADDLAQARDKAYRAVKEINWQGCYYRSDIGHHAFKNCQNCEEEQDAESQIAEARPPLDHA